MTNHESLTTSLVGKRTKLYQNSFHFHYSVDTLAMMLPLWIDALAAEAEKKDEQLKMAQRDLETMKPGMLHL